MMPNVVASLLCCPFFLLIDYTLSLAPMLFFSQKMTSKTCVMRKLLGGEIQGNLSAAATRFGC